MFSEIGEFMKDLRDLDILSQLILSQPCVATLALGLRPRQGVARLQAKRGARESHHMFLGVQRM